ncbi:acylphosphatase [Glaciibacter superstes]|uniref:acylphosphatase n=1 Tax=Glaciibacter superstes TaxID=501023 RepID=UPI0003B575E7
MGTMIRQHVVVHGMVQGVGFRYSARQQATRLGITGFARNQQDGTVELEIEGGSAAVERMLDWLRSGPRGAVVESVDTSELRPTGDDDFRITF